MSVLFGEYLSRCVRDFRQSSPPSLRISNALNVSCSSKTVADDFTACHRLRTGAPNDNFRKNICSEDDLRSRIFETFVVKFLACPPLLGFSNI